MLYVQNYVVLTKVRPPPSNSLWFVQKIFLPVGKKTGCLGREEGLIPEGNQSTLSLSLSLSLSHTHTHTHTHTLSLSLSLEGNQWTWNFQKHFCSCSEWIIIISSNSKFCSTIVFFLLLYWQTLIVKYCRCRLMLSLLMLSLGQS